MIPSSTLLPLAALGLLLSSPAAPAALTVIHAWTMGDEEKGATGSAAAATLVDTVGDLDLTLTGSPLYASAGGAIGVLFANTDSAHNVAASEYYEGLEADVNPADNTRWGMEAIVRIDQLPAVNQEVAVLELGAGANGLLLETYGPRAWALHQSNVAINAGTIPVTPGKLQHLAAVRSPGKWDLYVDGVLTTTIASADYEPAAGIRIGAGNAGNGNNRGFNGLIETVRVFDYTDEFDVQQTLLASLNPDADHDGFDDSVEKALGFNPNDPASTPETKSGIETAVEFSFHAAKNKKYTVQSSTDLQNWELVEKDIPGLGGEITRVYSIRGDSKRYYRSLRQEQ